MIETNAWSIENYVRMYGNNNLLNNLKNTKRDFLDSIEQSKDKMLHSLDQIWEDLLSNALKIKDNYMSGIDTFKNIGGYKDESGKP
jgi:hypothetical protein